MEPLWQLVHLLVQAAPVATLLSIYVIYRVLMTVRTNDLAHIESKITEGNQAIHARMDRLESRMDEWFVGK